MPRVHLVGSLPAYFELDGDILEAGRVMDVSDAQLALLRTRPGVTRIYSVAADAQVDSETTHPQDAAVMTAAHDALTPEQKVKVKKAVEPKVKIEKDKKGKK